MTPAEEAWERLNSRLEAVEGQRNRALTDHAVATGDLAIERLRRAAVEKELENYKINVATLNAKLATLIPAQEA